MNNKNTRLMGKWVHQDKIVKNLEKDFLIPNKKLTNVPKVLVKNLEDLNEIPDEGGCYWIWTDETVRHKLHKNEIPDGYNGGKIIYNGIAKDNVRSRIINHLFGEVENGWSAISMDLIFGDSKSHRKKAMSSSSNKSDKVAYLLDGTRIDKKDKLKTLKLSDIELNFVNSTNQKVIYFRNGINITEEKHIPYDFVVSFITGLKSTTYLEFIEKEWRHRNHTPQLCSYISGR